MSYKIKEIYYTLQGEGAHTGRAAIFCRFSGCNLWSGREVDRHKAICKFCDTDFWGTDGINGGTYSSAEALAHKILSLWPENPTDKIYVVCTGGEPMLQIDNHLIDTFHKFNIEIAIETNGTIVVPNTIDWICVSPKAGSKLLQLKGNELKLVVPQAGAEPEKFADLDFQHFFVQPMDGPDIDKNTEWAINFCKHHPKWKLSLQTHKLIGIP